MTIEKMKINENEDDGYPNTTGRTSFVIGGASVCFGPVEYAEIDARHKTTLLQRVILKTGSPSLLRGSPGRNIGFC
jgi:hypothetical protein